MSKLAVVTGAGSGVGQTVTLMLAERGWDVAAIGRRTSALEETVALSKKFKSKVVPFACDVGKESDVAAMAKAVQEKLGSPQALVNSAGINVPQRKLNVITNADFRSVIEINLMGTYWCVHEFLPLMRAGGGGTIVNIVSDAGVRATPAAGSSYIAAKFGQRGLAQAINLEERANGIRCCSVCPGEINTPILEKRPIPPPPEARLKMLQAEDVAKCVLLAIELPPRAIIEELLVRPA